MNRIKMFLSIVLIIGTVFFITDYKNSYKTINEALYSEEKSADFMQIKKIIGGSEYGGKAFYFFLNNENKVVGVTLNKGVFGWKHSIATSGSGLEIDKKQKLSKAINNSTNDSNKFYFGLTSYNNISEIKVNETNYATLIRLDEIIENKSELQNTYLWYIHLNDDSDKYLVEIYDNEYNLVISQ